jgi:hypothetical protein
MNVIARACDEKGLWVIITTHSPTIISRIPLEHLRLLVRDGEKVIISESGRRHQFAEILGGGIGYRGVMLVEDETAVDMTIALLDELSPDMLRQFEIIACGSTSNLSVAMKSFPKTKGWFNLVGVYDGDQQGKVNETDLQWPVAYLPGSAGPEDLLRKSLNADGAIDFLAGEVRRPRAEIAIALEATAGLENHDWLIEFAKGLAITKRDLVRCLTRVWLSSAEARASAASFTKVLEEHYDR